MYTAPPAGAARASRGEIAYGDLRRRLLVGEFPVAIRLAEERLAAEIGVSRTPVREALMRLHVEGLVERHPDGGYQPSTPNLAAIHELYEVRIALERLAIRRPATTGIAHDRAVLRRVYDEWLSYEAERPEPEPGFVALDEGFHVALAESAGNAQLAEMLEMVNARIRPVRMHDFLTAERVAATIAQHLGIVEALLASDLDLAADRLDEHLGESMVIVERRAAVAVARMLGQARPEGGPQPEDHDHQEVER